MAEIKKNSFSNRFALPHPRGVYAPYRKHREKGFQDDRLITGPWIRVEDDQDPASRPAELMAVMDDEAHLAVDALERAMGLEMGDVTGPELSL